MEDSEKNKERKVLTDEELEQVSGGRAVFDINEVLHVSCGYYSDATSCNNNGCYWSNIYNSCMNSKDQEESRYKLENKG